MLKKILFVAIVAAMLVSLGCAKKPAPAPRKATTPPPVSTPNEPNK